MKQFYFEKYPNILKKYNSLSTKGKLEYINSLAKTGSHCSYCLAQDYCPKIYAKLKSCLNADLSNQRTLEEIGSLIKPIEQMIDKVKAKIKNKLINGNKVKGFKLLDSIKIKNGIKI